jgi:thiamine biosynthesis lipoprotein
MTETVMQADLGGWVRRVHSIAVWGTVVTLEVRAASIDLDAADEAFADVGRWVNQVDRWFSTFRFDTPVTAMRLGMLAEADSPPVVQEVLARCRGARLVTEGAFDPWTVPGGLDPSGYVKGWAADRAADLLVACGFPNCLVNAAGDLTTRGWSAPDRPWTVPIHYVVHRESVVCTVEVVDSTVSTSGNTYRSAAVVDPFTGRPAWVSGQATVIGPDGGLADALSTALVVAGASEGSRWFVELPEWSAYVIDDGIASYWGPHFA